ncbi:hypothetical protein HDU76_005776 [Blyttiomyces sp. JEL0837]|nr:hypothetical protein HDU76_005776 [Blyttiomyces sp. JEL0837]
MSSSLSGSASASASASTSTSTSTTTPSTSTTMPSILQQNNTPAKVTGNVLVVGGTRGLGREIVLYLSRLAHQQQQQSSLVSFITSSDRPLKVFTTSRDSSSNSDLPSNVKIIPGIDITDPNSGDLIVTSLQSKMGIHDIDLLIMVAGYFSTDSLLGERMDWREERKIFEVCAIGPLFVIQAIVKSGLMKAGSKIAMITSEAGSIALRTPEEGGGMYGHHMSKAAQNMMGKLLSIDLIPKAVDPSEAVEPILKCIENLTMANTGSFLAPLGPRGIGNAHVIGPVESLPTPLRLPW